MINNQRFIFLVQQYSNGFLEEEEQEELFSMITSGDYDVVLGSEILRGFTADEHKLTTDLPPHVAEEIVRNIFRAEKNVAVLIPAKRVVPGIRWWVAAAVVAGLAFTLQFLLWPGHSRSAASFNALIPDSAITRLNTGRTVQQLSLPDGSVVWLKPESSIYYRAQFASGKREVFLKGEASFEIAKNVHHPFLVYYQHIVTKVLGTSFTINTNPATGHVEVVVKTGKVQVYENEKLVDGHENNAVIVTPNEKAIYKEDNGSFQTTLVETPQPIHENGSAVKDPAATPKTSFVYDQEKLSNIFAHLKEMYGIEIAVENESINDCLFTGDLSDNNLYNKLKIICLTTNASFEVNGTTILITGAGCN